eukprot:jgi/Psemu1/24221/gm1.24221_g
MAKMNLMLILQIVPLQGQHLVDQYCTPNLEKLYKAEGRTQYKYINTFFTMETPAAKSYSNILSQLVGTQPVVMAPNALDIIAFRKQLGNAEPPVHTKKTSSTNRKRLADGSMEDLDSAARTIIHHKFPKKLMDKVDKRFDALPAKMTARQAYKHTETLHHLDPEDCRQKIYTPGPNGAKEYFTETIVDQGSINLQGVGEMGDLTIMPYCLEAFWNQTTGTDMAAFQTFWVKRLTGILSTKKHSAAANCMPKVQKEMDSMRADDHIKWDNTPRVGHAGSDCTSGGITIAKYSSRSNASTITAPSVSGAMENYSGGATSGDRPARVWKEWKCYCYGCAINLSQDMTQCPWKTKAAKFQEHNNQSYQC